MSSFQTNWSQTQNPPITSDMTRKGDKGLDWQI
jgi:hypothetical protein